MNMLFSLLIFLIIFFWPELAFFLVFCVTTDTHFWLFLHFFERSGQSIFSSLMADRNFKAMTTADKILVLLRGLPSCGKSFRAKQLLEACAAKGVGGVVYSTDDFFYSQVKPESPHEYSFVPNFLPQAHKWNLLRAQKSIEFGCPFVVVDNTNVTASEPKAYVSYALDQNYEIRIEEPTSEWWLEIRELLKDKRANKQSLKEWAVRLSEKSKDTHKVPPWSIEKMMWKWVPDLTVENILAAPSLN